MALGRWQSTIVDGAGNIVNGASVTVRREVAGAPLATIYSDRDGQVSLGNPFTVGADGFAAFHATGGAYRIDATKDGQTRTWRYVPVGLAGEGDIPVPGIYFAYDSSTADADPGDGQIRLNNATLGSVTTLYLDDLDFIGMSVDTFVKTWDDFGDSAARGNLVMRSSDNAVWAVFLVTGSVTDASGYNKVAVTVQSSFGTPTEGMLFGLQFVAYGSDGFFTGAEATVTAARTDLIAIKDASDSNNPKFATESTIGAGKQTIWVPASAMKLHSGPAFGSFSASSTQFDYIALDPGSSEDASFLVAMPKGWDESNVSYQVYWTHPATVTNFGVVFEMFARAYSNDELIDGASYTSLTTVTDTGGTTNDCYISPESTPTNIANDAENDLVHFIIRRVGGNGSDTLAVDAYLIGVKLFYTCSANTDD